MLDAAAGGRQFAAQIGLGLARIFEFVAQPLELIIALGQDAALIAKAGFEFLDAAIEHFRFGLMHKSCRSRSVVRVPRSPSLPRAAVNSFAAASASARSRAEPALGLLDRPLVIGDADLHRFDLGAERRDLGALAVGDQRSFAEFAEQFRQLRLLVGELPLGLAQRARLDLEFLLGRAQLVA